MSTLINYTDELINEFATQEATSVIKTADLPAQYAELKTTSDKIRAMTKDGYKRNQIAKLLNIRYQHVRNVELQVLKK